MVMTIDWLLVVVLVLVLVVASLTPVLTDNLSRFYSKAVR